MLRQSEDDQICLHTDSAQTARGWWLARSAPCDDERRIQARLQHCAGAYAADIISEEERFDVVRNACPGPGACGGMYTANTMASAIEALGMSLPYSSSTPAEDPLKRLECRKAGL